MRALACAVVAALALIALSPPGAAAATCPDGRDGPGWTLSTTTFDNHYTRHAYVGNGYLSQRVPPAGTGCMSTGEKTGWPLYTPRYDGAFVAGLYGRVKVKTVVVHWTNTLPASSSIATLLDGST